MQWNLPSKRNLPVIDFLLKERGLEKSDNFFSPTVKNLPSALDTYGVKNASKVIYDAIKNKKKIFIHGDFDADGITATALLWDFLFRELKADVTPYIPDRFDEGYGLSEKSITAMIEQGAEYIITVDCGIKDIELVSKYSEKVNFIITDHHTVRSSSEEGVKDALMVGDYLISAKALAVVHPKIENNNPPEISGAAVAWKLCSGINELYIHGTYVNRLLGLVAIGTVCDIMPLTGENRIYVSIGLDVLNSGEYIGINELCKVAGIDSTQIKSMQLGYMIGPRLNAAGRLGSAMDSVRLLTTNSVENAKILAQKLNQLNLTRQNLTTRYLLEAEKLITDLDNEILYIVGNKWPEGILGLIAGKLAEKYNRPSIVLSNGDEYAKGSARSISGFNIVEALNRHSTLLSRFGGHELAAGLTIKKNNVDKLGKKLNNFAKSVWDSKSYIKTLFIDTELTLNELSFQLADDLRLLEPFGYRNEEPVFAIFDLTLLYYKTMGADNTHIRAFLNDSLNNEIEVISFNNANSIIDIFNANTSKHFDVAGRINEDNFNGNKKIKFFAKDFRPSI